MGTQGDFGVEQQFEKNVVGLQEGGDGGSQKKEEVWNVGLDLGRILDGGAISIRASSAGGCECGGPWQRPPGLWCSWSCLCGAEWPEDELGCEMAAHISGVRSGDW